MDFINRYWAVLLIAFILIMLVILSYLIDKEMNRKNKKNDIKKKKEYNIEFNENKIDDTSDLKEEISEEDLIEEDSIKEDLIDDNNNEDRVALDYDELDVEDIDSDFNKIISKKHIINDELINDIKNIKVDSVHINKIDDNTNIELPDIKIKKDINDEDIW